MAIVSADLLGFALRAQILRLRFEVTASSQLIDIQMHSKRVA